MSGLPTVSTNWDRYSEESVLVLDEDKLRLLGATPDQVVGQLPLKGAPVSSLSRLPSVGALPVRTYFDEAYRSNPQTLMLLPIQLANGQVVSLSQVAHLQRQKRHRYSGYRRCALRTGRACLPENQAHQHAQWRGDGCCCQGGTTRRDLYR